MIETFTALADPNRFRIVEHLLGGARSVGAIGEALHLNQPQVSKHLRVLKDAGLVDVEARAQQRLYGLRPEPLRELKAWLERYRDIWDERLGQLDSVIEELKTQDTETAQRHARKKKG